jgi:hypothetical protein
MRTVKMKKVHLIAGLLLMSVFSSFNAFAQQGTPCTAPQNDSNYLFFSNCQTGPSYTVTGNYYIDVMNNTTIKINGNLTINGTLTINFQSNSASIEVLNGFTLTATNITFSGNPTGKTIIVDGPSGKITVPGTLDFGGRNIDIDGSGTISAGTVTGGANVTCAAGDADCPGITVTGSCTGGGICSDGGLPIQLSSFSAESSKDAVELKWSTSTELNFDYFSIERSSNGENFSELAKVSGHGTSKEIHKYSYEDSRPFIGKNYYRLKSVDFDGYEESFNTVSIKFLGEKQFDVAPNPSNGQGVSFIFNFPVEDESTVTVFDNLGIVMGAFNVTDDRSISFQNTLKSGVYYAKFSSPSLSKVARFVVKE